MRIKNAIIIHGPGRSGTTLLSNILALHPDLGWISSYVNKYPERAFLTQANKLQQWDAFEQWNRTKSNFPRPTEAYRFWLHYLPEFNNEVASISEADSKRAINAVQRVLKNSGKRRFMTKITGMSRHQFITAVFENPIIVWINRNPMSVITSYHKKRWGYKNKPELFASKTTEELLKEYTEKYLAFQNDKRNLKQFQLLEVNYEDLVADRYRFFKRLCDEVALNYSSKFEKKVASWDIDSGTNETYKKYFSEAEQQYITNLLQA